MEKVLAILAPGFEETEAVAVIDLLRRADINTTMAGLNGKKITGSHGISVECDTVLEDVDPDSFDFLFLPGGQPGSENLKKSSRVLTVVQDFSRAGKGLAAICAAPTVLQEAGVLFKRKMTSYPSEEKVFSESIYIAENVVVDGNLITSRGVGTAIEFALRLIEMMKGEKEAREQASRILFDF